MALQSPDDPSSSSMSPIDKAIAAKAAGNAAFAAGKFRKALVQYKLVYMHIGPMGSRHEEHKRIIDRAMIGEGGGDPMGWIPRRRAAHPEQQLTESQQLTIDGTIASSYSNMAMTEIQLLRYSKALLAAEVALLYTPDDPKVWYRQGLAFLRLGRTDEAASSFRRVIELAPENSAEARARLAEVAVIEADTLQRQRKAFKKMFDE